VHAAIRQHAITRSNGCVTLGPETRSKPPQTGRCRLLCALRSLSCANSFSSRTNFTMARSSGRSSRRPRAGPSGSAND
jgi:hypothetical protein